MLIGETRGKGEECGDVEELSVLSAHFSALKIKSINK